MKITLLFFFMGIVCIGQGDPVWPESPDFSSENRVKLHVDRNFKGGSLAILRTDGVQLMARTLRSRKVVIDFSGVQRGTYTISLRKGAYHNTILFTKR